MRRPNIWVILAIKGSIGGIIVALWSLLTSCIDPGLDSSMKIVVMLIAATLGIVVWKFVSAFSLKKSCFIMTISVGVTGLVLPNLLILFRSSTTPTAINWMAVLLLASGSSILIFSHLSLCQKRDKIDSSQGLNKNIPLLKIRRMKGISSILLFCYLGFILIMVPRLFPIKKGVILFQQAIRNNDVERILALLHQGNQVNIKHPHDLSTPLHWAIRSQHNGILALLLEKGAELNAKNREGRTPLHEAILGGNSVAIDMLLAKGASINAQDKTGSTPLHLAALFGNISTIERLLEHGADMNIQNNLGKTPLQMIMESHVTEKEKIIELFRRYETTE